MFPTLSHTSGIFPYNLSFMLQKMWEKVWETVVIDKLYCLRIKVQLHYRVKRVIDLANLADCQTGEGFIGIMQHRKVGEACQI